MLKGGRLHRLACFCLLGAVHSEGVGSGRLDGRLERLFLALRFLLAYSVACSYHTSRPFPASRSSHHNNHNATRMYCTRLGNHGFNQASRSFGTLLSSTFSRLGSKAWHGLASGHGNGTGMGWTGQHGERGLIDFCRLRK